MNTTEQLFDYIAQFRGHFINKMAFIERKLEIVIARHYCGDEDKMVEFIDFLLGEKFLSFEGKRNAFAQIIEKHYPKMFIEKASQFSNINDIMPERNKLAHYMVFANEDAIQRFENDKTFALLQYFEKKKPIWYDLEKQHKIATSLDEVFKWMQEI